MAIVFEEQKNSSGALNVMIWLVLIIILGLGTYYVFVKKPDLVPVRVPPNFEDTQEIVKIKLNPEDIIDNPQFRALIPYITVQPVETNGKANPFLSF